MNKIKYVKLEQPDGSYSDNIPLAVDSDHVDVNGKTLTNELNNKATKAEVQAVASGSPAGVYATVAALISADPDHSKIYVVIENGHWYYYGNGQWNDGGDYQGSKISDNSIHLNNLDELLKQFYQYDYSNFIDKNSDVEWLSNKYYNTAGILTNSNDLNCTDINVNAGEVYYIYGYGGASARAYVLAGNDAAIDVAENGWFNDIIIIPENRNKLYINHWKNKPIPIVKKYNNLILDNNIKLDLMKSIPNSIYARSFTNRNSGDYFKYITFKIPDTTMHFENNDEITIDLDITTKGNLKDVVLFTDTTGASTWSTKQISKKIFNNSIFYHALLDITVNKSISDFRFILSPSFENSYDGDAYMYNIKITNLSTNENLVINEYLEENASLESFSPIVYLLSTELKNYITSFLPPTIDKKIYCAGDSLTVGGNRCN